MLLNPWMLSCLTCFFIFFIARAHLGPTLCFRLGCRVERRYLCCVVREYASGGNNMPAAAKTRLPGVLFVLDGEDKCILTAACLTPLLSCFSRFSVLLLKHAHMLFYFFRFRRRRSTGSSSCVQWTLASSSRRM